VQPGRSDYHAELATTTSLDQTLSLLRQDAIDRFKLGQKLEAKAYFKGGVIDAIKNAHKDELLDHVLDAMLRAVRLVELSGFENDLDRVIDFVKK
jgi:hypothetical protein